MLAFFFLLSAFFGILVQSRCKNGEYDKDLDFCFCETGWYGTFCNRRYSDRCNSPTNLVGFKTRNTSESESDRVNIIASVYNCNNTDDSDCAWSSWERLKLSPNQANKKLGGKCRNFQQGNADYTHLFNDYTNIKGITIYNCGKSGWGIDYITIYIPSDKTYYRIDSFCGNLAQNNSGHGLDEIENNSNNCNDVNDTLYDGYWSHNVTSQMISVQYNSSSCTKYNNLNYIYTCVGESMSTYPDGDASIYCGYEYDFDNNNDNIDGGLVAGVLIGIVFVVCVVVMIGSNVGGIGDIFSAKNSNVSFDTTKKHREDGGGFRTISTDEFEPNDYETAEQQNDRL